MRRIALALMLLLSAAAAFEFLTPADVSSATRKTQPAERKKPSPEDVPFWTVDRGTRSGITRRDTFVIKDDAQWLALWQQHTQDTFPAPAAPHIDFNNEMVIAVFAGERNTTAYAVQIDRIRRSDGKLVVSVVEVNPGPKGGKEFDPSGTVEPYDMVRLAQSSLPVEFQGF